MLTKLYHLHALSALHVGTGQAIGAVDLPIARAKGTQLPLVPGSALKGVSREAFRLSKNSGDSESLFGPSKIEKADDAYASALAFGDAHLLLLPARSMAGIMAWVTCPFVLTRYRRDLLDAGTPKVPDLPTNPGSDHVLVTTTSALKLGNPPKVVFDDLDLPVHTGNADTWARLLAERIFPGDSPSAEEFLSHFAVVGDDNFAFLAQTGTEVRARVAIDHERGVVRDGALWYEENLPAETVLWGLMGVDRAHGKRDLDALEVWRQFTEVVPDATPIQIGGKASVGRGLVRFLKGA